MQRLFVVPFDATNPDHRRDFFKVLETGSFGNCQNRYELQGRYGDVLSLMMDQTVKYYVEKEFGETIVDCTLPGTQL